MDTTPKKTIPQDAAPYEILAAGYDLVMSHVDYEEWAVYIHQLLMKHSPADVETVIELGCGTGLFAIELQPLADYTMAGIDKAPNMIRFAKERAEWEGIPVQFEVADFTDFKLDQAVDAMILLQDGLNYLLHTEDIMRLFSCVYNGLKAGGLFVFDLSTPHNSINNAAYFDDEDEEGGFHYIRKSHYEPVSKIHTTKFTLNFQQQTYYETHIQQAYTFEEIHELIRQTPFVLLAAYNDTTLKPADTASERIHWILQKIA
ncbi:MAG: methyltransferase domain-containing protein [Bacteroidetes Order II. Incertae sedis bacterium]|nr:methyltransferase domain-containing protein [Bacteroidetes Order II. bacterium]